MIHPIIYNSLFETTLRRKAKWLEMSVASLRRLTTMHANIQKVSMHVALRQQVANIEWRLRHG